MAMALRRKAPPRLAISMGDPAGIGPEVILKAAAALAGRRAAPSIIVIGDLAGATDRGAPLPMLIPVAMQEGRHVAATISELVANGGAHAFRYKDPGIMATIGRNSAVAQLGAVHLSGFLGWLMWLAVHLVNVISFRSRILVLVNWAWDYLFYDRPIRLIVRARDPK